MTTLVHEAGMWARVYARGKLMGFIIGLPVGAAAVIAVMGVVVRWPHLCSFVH